MVERGVFAASEGQLALPNRKEMEEEVVRIKTRVLRASICTEVTRQAHGPSVMCMCMCMCMHTASNEDKVVPDMKHPAFCLKL